MASNPTFSQQDANSVSERRRFARMRLQALEYAEVGAQNGGVLLDVSEGGLAVRLVARQEPGEVFSIWFKLADCPRIETEGRVVWSVDGGKKAGIQFVNLPRNSQQELRAWSSVREFTAEDLEESRETAGLEPEVATAPPEPSAPVVPPKLAPRIVTLPSAASSPAPAPPARERVSPSPAVPPEDTARPQANSARPEPLQTQRQARSRIAPPPPAPISPRYAPAEARQPVRGAIPKNFFDLFLYVLGLVRVEAVTGSTGETPPTILYDPEDPQSRNVTLSHAIIALEKSVWEALRTRSRSAYANLLAEEYREICDGTVLQKSDALQNFDQGTLTDFQMSGIRVSHHDQRTAVISYKIRLKGFSCGHPLPNLPYYVTSIWTNHRGVWMLTMSWGCWG